MTCDWTYSTKMKIWGSKDELYSSLLILRAYSEYKRDVSFGVLDVFMEEDMFIPACEEDEVLWKYVESHSGSVEVSARGLKGNFETLNDVDIFRELADAIPGARFEAEITGDPAVTKQNLECELHNGTLYITVHTEQEKVQELTYVPATKTPSATCRPAIQPTASDKSVLLVCSVCGIQKEDDGTLSSCPMCGGDFVRLTEDSDSATPMQEEAEQDDTFYPALEKSKLYQLAVPVIEDDSNIEKAAAEIKKYLEKRTKNYPGEVFSFLWSTFSKTVSEAKYDRECTRQVNEQVLRNALNSYKSTKNAPSPGLGFSIITNSTASAAAYVGLAAFEEKKHRLRQEISAAEKFTKELRAMSAAQSDACRIFIEGLDRIIHNFTAIHTANIFVNEHRGFYLQSAVYDTGLSLVGVNIYQLLTHAAKSSSKIIGTSDTLQTSAKKEDLEWILIQLDGAGYIKCLDKTHYVTTGKFETAILKNQYYLEHPEEKVADEKAANTTKAEQYHLAENLLQNKKYYQAAVTFAGLEGYRDALKRSMVIWKEKILSQNLNLMVPGSFYMTTNGTVRPSEVNIAPEKRQQWDRLENIKQIRNLGFGYYVAITHQGQMLTHLGSDHITKYNSPNWKKTNVSAISNAYTDSIAFLYEDGTVAFWGKLDKKEINLSHWNNIVKIYNDYYSIIGIKKDGTIIAEGKITALSQDYRKWKNVADIKYCGPNYLVALTTDGKVLAAGGKREDYDAISRWTNIADVIVIANVPVGITCAGTALWGSRSHNNQKERIAHLLSQTGIVAVSSDIGHYIALKADGTVCTNLEHKDYTQWTDIVAVKAQTSFDYAIRANGSVVVSANYSRHDEEVKEAEKWKLFDHIDTLQEEKNQIIRNNLQAQMEEQKQKLKKFFGPFFKKQRQAIQENIDALEQKLADLS